MSFDGSNVSRLEGSSGAPGGLIVRKSGNDTPKASSGSSLLGLQKLAEEKRKEREYEDGKVTKKQKRNTWEDDDGDDRTSSAKHRHYRLKMVETPSHPGGVSDVYKEKKRRRDERDREQRRGGVYADTKRREDKELSRDDRREDVGSRRDRNSSSRQDRRDDLGSKRDRSSRSRGDSTRSTRGRYDWEETPSSRRSRDEREYTPSHSTRGLYA